MTHRLFQFILLLLPLLLLRGQEVPLPYGAKRLPDGNLASYVQEQTGRDILCWPGGCPVHGRLSPEELASARQEHPPLLRYR